MKKLFLITAALSVLATSVVYAANKGVEDAIKSREDLSLFYEALQKTNVLEELEEGKAYAIFAPTNEAFEKIYNKKDKYPCFGHEECLQDFTDVMRNHFVPGYFDLRRQNGLFAINDRQITVGHPHRGHDSVDGNMVESTSQLFGSVLYRIDGVIMNDNEGKMFRRKPLAKAPEPAADMAEDLPAASSPAVEQ